jgi:hypothetical protein
VAQLVEALRYKSEDRGFDSRLEFFIDIILYVKDVDKNCETNGTPLVKTNKQLQTKVYITALTDLMMVMWDRNM